MATQADLARHLGLTTRRIKQLVAQGAIPCAERGRVDIRACRLAYTHWLRTRGGDIKPGGLDPVRERARKDKEMADKLALENQVRRGELVEVDEVSALWTKLCIETRTRIMAIPTNAAPLVIGCDGISRIQAILEEHIYDALAILAEPDRDELNEHDDD